MDSEFQTVTESSFPVFGIERAHLLFLVVRVRKSLTFLMFLCCNFVNAESAFFFPTEIPLQFVEIIKIQFG